MVTVKQYVQICSTPGVYIMTDWLPDVNFRHSSQYCQVSLKFCPEKETEQSTYLIQNVKLFDPVWSEVRTG